MRALLVGLIALGVSALGLGRDGVVQPTQEATAEALTRVQVIDGDTIQDLRTQTTYRIVNIDTPEAGRNARCAAERRLAARATARTRALISAAHEVSTEPVGRIDTYGRTIARVLIDGRDLGEALIAEGLARPWRGRRQPWCASDGRLLPN